MKRYTLDVQENDDGDCYVQFPDELMEELGWKAGDLLEYTEDEYGSLYLNKVEDNV
jgi:bifunctional DNA-binding transcriptional regulator/antitoxin component of YhaV-PrlF toxin-antitoxin module|tara:strand:- start:3439 stop:3606 length:168 start_codon:yes stop_codon:yes gene_type:complete